MKVKQREFLSLTQGNMSVSEYLHKFNHLASYSLYDVATEERKIDRFLGGLNQHLRSALCMLDFLDFQSLVNKVLIAEREYKPVHDNRPTKMIISANSSLRRMDNQCRRLVHGSRLRLSTNQIGSRMLT